MKMNIKKFSELTGVSVRTLHYYDEIGLLKPAFIDKQNSYRYYDENSLIRMQEILFYRELDFELKSIMKILSSKNYDKKKALSEQKKLLTLKRDRIERMIIALEKAEKGETDMKAFSNKEYEQTRKKYEAEAKEKWGNTEAYKEQEKKTKNYSEDKWTEANGGLMAVFAEFAECKNKGFTPDSNEAQALANKLQKHISENYYTCTKEILKGLGQMYVCDERFKNNIDSYGEGTADFASKAIEIYTK